MMSRVGGASPTTTTTIAATSFTVKWCWRWTSKSFWVSTKQRSRSVLRMTPPPHVVHQDTLSPPPLYATT